MTGGSIQSKREVCDLCFRESTGGVVGSGALLGVDVRLGRWRRAAGMVTEDCLFVSAWRHFMESIHTHHAYYLKNSRADSLRVRRVGGCGVVVVKERGLR